MPVGTLRSITARPTNAEMLQQAIAYVAVADVAVVVEHLSSTACLLGIQRFTV